MKGLLCVAVLALLIVGLGFPVSAARGAMFESAVSPVQPTPTLEAPTPEVPTGVVLSSFTCR